MKQYFEWKQATPDNLPKDQRYLNLQWIGQDGYRKPLAGNYDPAGFFNTPLGRYEPKEIEYLTPASPLPISGDVQKMAEEYYQWYLKNKTTTGFTLCQNVIQEAFIAGRQAGEEWKEEFEKANESLQVYVHLAEQRKGEVEKLVSAINNLMNKSGRDIRFLNSEAWNELMEALKPYQSPVK